MARRNKDRFSKYAMRGSIGAGSIIGWHGLGEYKRYRKSVGRAYSHNYEQSINKRFLVNKRYLGTTGRDADKIKKVAARLERVPKLNRKVHESVKEVLKGDQAVSKFLKKRKNITKSASWFKRQYSFLKPSQKVFVPRKRFFFQNGNPVSKPFGSKEAKKLTSGFIKNNRKSFGLLTRKHLLRGGSFGLAGAGVIALGSLPSLLRNRKKRKIGNRR